MVAIDDIVGELVQVSSIDELKRARDILDERIEYLEDEAEDGIRDRDVTGVQTCALPI